MQSVFDSIFDEATAVQALALGDIVYLSSLGNVDLARANAIGTYKAIGVITTAGALGDTVEFQTQGIVGGFSGLTANTVYYLSESTAGAETAISPTIAGDYVVILGKAISATELLFLPSTVVRL